MSDLARLVAGKIDVFHWKTTRAASCLEKIIPVEFEGKLQCDGYQAYDCSAKSRREQIELARCMAHLRLKFYEANETAPEVAGWFLTHFKNLYQLEDRLRQARAGSNLRQAERVCASRPVPPRMHGALVRPKTARRYLPQSLISKAIHYALSQWPSLQLFIEDGRLERRLDTTGRKGPCYYDRDGAGKIGRRFAGRPPCPGKHHLPVPAGRPGPVLTIHPGCPRVT